MTSEQRVRQQRPNAWQGPWGIYESLPGQPGRWIGKDWDHAASRLPLITPQLPSSQPIELLLSDEEMN